MFRFVSFFRLIFFDCRRTHRTSLVMLMHYCSSFPGFCRLRTHNKSGAPVAFVEFTVWTAANALP